jgi:CoA:oxalate CoA-transferase
MTGFPVKLSATPCRLRLPVPELGAHTEEVLRELGLESEIPRLRAQRVI